MGGRNGCPRRRPPGSRRGGAVRISRARLATVGAARLGGVPTFGTGRRGIPGRACRGGGQRDRPATHAWIQPVTDRARPGFWLWRRRLPLVVAGEAVVRVVRASVQSGMWCRRARANDVRWSCGARLALGGRPGYGRCGCSHGWTCVPVLRKPRDNVVRPDDVGPAVLGGGRTVGVSPHRGDCEADGAGEARRHSSPPQRP